MELEESAGGVAGAVDDESVGALGDVDCCLVRTSVAPRAQFRWSTDLQQPATFGIWRPLILLPRRFDDLSEEGKLTVACHELLHVQRRDWLWTLVEAHVRAIFWFHPAIWWLADRLQLLREQVVDHLVVERTSSRGPRGPRRSSPSPCARTPRTPIASWRSGTSAASPCR